MNNDALLTWAVENIKEWDDKYTHIRADSEGVIYTKGLLWEVKDKIWIDFNPGDNNRNIGPSISCVALVITKEEWEAAKNIPKIFTKADLKTGMILEFNNGELAMVLRGTANGDIIAGQTWARLSCDTHRLGAAGHHYVIKVYQPENNMDYLYKGLHTNHPIIWEFDPNSEERRKLEEQIQEQQAVLEQLKAKLKEL